ncbi:hypothetical protein E2562_038466 [Oryza meyeriana var. granulata]|uniref:Uncharacterized protein n=1 Tax=Oryza meyeriana var. granulata TaxID=110450 RepID=A0A6G1E9G2_9ORYZ|nr:hypothetical protein E2562_038466 [Oryza meyeriana var. granulata]
MHPRGIVVVGIVAGGLDSDVVRDASPAAQGGISGDGRAASPDFSLSDDGTPTAMVPPCIIDWSHHLSRAEEVLHSAVLVTVIGLNRVVSPDEVA